MSESVILRSFAAGELAPGLYARADLAKYVTAARTLRNFIVRRHGGASLRPGHKYVGTMKPAGRFLRPFIFKAANASFAIEIGDGYFRFIQNGAYVQVAGVAAYNGATAYVPGDLVVQGGINYYCIAATTGNAPPNVTFWYALSGTTYEVPHPYVVGDFEGSNSARWTQQGSVVSITHLSYAPRELGYVSATRWVLTTVSTAASQAAPTAPAGVAGGAGAKTFKYVIVAASSETYEESAPSATITIAAAADPTPAAPHALSWVAAPGAVEYRVFGDAGYGNGVFGYLGTAVGLAFNDVGQVADFNQTPPIPRVLFSTTNNYPQCSSTFQQRRVYAGTHTNREKVYASQTGFPHNFQIRSPIQDDDAVTFTLASEEIQPIQHLVALKVGLVILTDSREWVISGDELGVLKPTAIGADQHGYMGAGEIKPVVIGNSIIYVQSLGNQLRDLRFDERVDGLGGRDLCLYAAHLFKGRTVRAMALQKIPDSVVWVVLDDGTLLGLTYIREEDVWGWHRHDTQAGSYYDVCVIPEAGGDAVYVAINRGQSGFYVERLATLDYTVTADAFHVDAGITFTSGVATTAVTGLTHLNGAVVYAFCDGTRVEGPFTVSGGAITLATASLKVQVGIAITADLGTLDLDVGGSDVRDRKKRVSNVSLLLEASFRNFKVGPDASNLLDVSVESYETDTAPFTGTLEQGMTAGYGDNGRVFIRHTKPTPLNILAVIPHVTVGG